MSAPPRITIDDVRIAGVVCTILALIATVTRLGERIRTRKWGWDDTWAAICLAAFIMFVFALFTFFGDIGDPSRLRGLLGVAVFYMLAQGFYAVIWCARLSIIASVIRITPPGRQHKLFRYASYVMGGFYCGLAIQTFVVCEQHPSWKDLALPQCPLGKEVAIAQLITDILSDAILIAAPVTLLWNVGTTVAQRNRLIAIFSSTIATTAVSLVHAVYIIEFGGLPEIFSAIIEMAVSLIVCSLSVLVPLVPRLLGPDRRSKGSTSQGNSQSLGVSNPSGKQTRSIQFESIGDFSPRPEYTFGRVTVIAGPQETQLPVQPDGPSKEYRKESLYPYNNSVGCSHLDRMPTFSAPFVYSSKEEEAAARRGWAKGVKVAREVIANTPLDKDQYTYQVKTIMHHSKNPTSRPTRTDLEDYWGSGIQAIREEDVSSF